MKKVLLMMCFVAGFGVSKAQEETSFSDEELTSYATVMVWAADEKERMTDVYNGWINNDETLVAARFVEIRNTGEDSLKLAEIEATDDELTAFKQIQVNYDSMTTSFKEVYIGKIKEDIGAGLYNSLKKEMKADADLKARYKAIYDGLLEEETSEEDESDD